MKRLEELGISPAPWTNILNNGLQLNSVWDAMSGCVLSGGYAESIDDARLITAAPEMYSVLWDFCFGKSTTVNCSKCGSNDHGDGIEHCSKTCPLYKARVALAKASGVTR